MDSRPSPSRAPVFHEKRAKLTSVACNSCRRRKSKCDGQRPVCTPCKMRGCPCDYDMNEDGRKLPLLRDEIRRVKDENSILNSVIDLLKTCEVEEWTQVMLDLRSGADLSSLLHNSKGKLPISTPQQSTLIPTQTDGYALELLAKTALLTSLASKTSPESTPQDEDRGLHEVEVLVTSSSQQSNSALQRFGLVQASSGGVPRAHTPLEQHDLSDWINLTSDSHHVNSLMSLYFSWQHSFFQSFPETLFRQDLQEGMTRFCSKALLHAICAAGIILQTHSTSSSPNPEQHLVENAAFSAESVRMLGMEMGSNLPAIATMSILSHIEGFYGRFSNMWMYCGRSARMALDLNLHLKVDGKALHERSSEAQVEMEARNRTFWGCFVADQFVSFTLGRLPQIPAAAITIDLPSVIAEEDAQPWIPFGSALGPQGPGGCSTLFREVAYLSTIVNSTLLRLLAPSKPIRASLVLCQYDIYLTWYDRLPANVALQKDSPSPTIWLHLYYHCAILVLFRPFLRATLVGSDVKPFDVCSKSAVAISELFAQHFGTYGTLGVCAFHIRCLLNACIIHLLNSSSGISAAYFETACEYFHRLEKRLGDNTNSIEVLKGLAQRWKINLSARQEKALYLEVREELRAHAKHESLLSTVELVETHKPHDQVTENPMAFPSPAWDRSLDFSASGASEQAQRGMEQPHDAPWHSDHIENHLPYIFAPFPNEPTPQLMPTSVPTSGSADSEAREGPMDVTDGFQGFDFEGPGGWLDPYMGYREDT